MKLTIHRGAKEIGGSCVEIIGKKSRLVVDIGIPLVDHLKVAGVRPRAPAVLVRGTGHQPTPAPPG